MFKVTMKGTTIPYQITSELGASRVLLKPASQGTGVIAGGAVRAIVERAGIKDILTKNLGSKNRINTARATIEGLKSLKTVEQFAKKRAPVEDEPVKKKKDKKGEDSASSGEAEARRTVAREAAAAVAQQQVEQAPAPAVEAAAPEAAETSQE
jgi:hypothetical protein